MKKNIRQLKPEDLPKGVITHLGEDDRGRCYIFDHEVYGRLGRLVMISVEANTQKLQYDFFEGDEARDSKNYLTRLEIYKEVVKIVNQAFEGNFPSKD